MAFTTPSTWTNGNVVTDTQLNQQLRDNLRYLKGLDGAVTIESDLAITRSAAGSTVAAYVDNSGGSSSGTLSRFALGMTPLEANALLFQYDHNANEATIYQRGGGDLVIQAATGNLVLTAGKTGIGTASPTGKLHIKGSIANWVFFEYDGVDGTARTVLATSSASYAQTGFALCRPSNGAAAVVTNLGNVPLGSFNISDVAGNTCQLTAASGGFTVARIAGALTYKVSIFLMTI
jgi:hypothetical protein